MKMKIVSRFKFSEQDIRNINEISSYLDCIHDTLDEASGIQVDDIIYMSKENFYKLYDLFDTFQQMVNMNKGQIEIYE